MFLGSLVLPRQLHLTAPSVLRASTLSGEEFSSAAAALENDIALVEQNSVLDED